MKMCVLDETKICDNCMKCVVSEGAEYRAIKIDGIQLPESESESGSK